MTQGSEQVVDDSLVGDGQPGPPSVEQKQDGDSPLLEQPQVATSYGHKDLYYAVFVVFVLHGIGIMLPWNMFINAKDYFENYKLDTNSSRDADYRKNFMNYIGLSAQLPNILMIAFNVFFQPTKTALQSGSDLRKLMVVIILEICVCVITIALAVINSYDWPGVFFGITVACIVLLNCCAGVYQSSAYGMAALLPMKYSNAIVLGNNVCGTLIALVNIASKAASARNLQLTAVLYFSSAVVLLCCCIASLIVLPKLRFYRYYQATEIELPMEQQEQKASIAATQATDKERGALLNTAAPASGEELPSVAIEPATADDGGGGGGGGICGQFGETAVECCALCCVSGGSEARQSACKRYWSRYWEAFRQCWVHCLSVWSVFFCTLSCFPALQSAVQPVTLVSISGWFADIFVFLFFNLFAMVGSIVSTFVQWPSPRYLVACVWPRTVIFIIFFLLCNCFSDNRRSGFPVLIASDAAFITGMILFALTSGYLSSLCMMYAPKSVTNAEKHAGLAAMLAAFFLVLGVFTGILFGTFLTNIVQAA